MRFYGNGRQADAELEGRCRELRVDVKFNRRTDGWTMCLCLSALWGEIFHCLHTDLRRLQIACNMRIKTSTVLRTVDGRFMGEKNLASRITNSSPIEKQANDRTTTVSALGRKYDAKSEETEGPSQCQACYRNICNRTIALQNKSLDAVARRKDQYCVTRYSVIVDNGRLADQQLIAAPSLHITWVVERACETDGPVHPAVNSHRHRLQPNAAGWQRGRRRRRLDLTGRAGSTAHWPHRTRNLIRPLATAHGRRGTLTIYALRHNSTRNRNRLGTWETPFGIAAVNVEIPTSLTFYHCRSRSGRLRRC